MNSQESFQSKTDAEIIELAKTEPEIFGFVIKRYQEKLFRYVRRISYFGNEDIEDILQDTFIKVYKNINDYDQSLKFSSWIYRITRNQTIDQIRKNSRSSQVLSFDEGDLNKLLKSSINLVRELEEKESFEKAKIAIQNLPEKYREVLVLRFLEEKDYEEIMDILKKPKGTIATLIKRGRERLEKSLT